MSYDELNGEVFVFGWVVRCYRFCEVEHGNEACDEIKNLSDAIYSLGFARCDGIQNLHKSFDTLIK